METLSVYVMCETTISISRSDVNRIHIENTKKTGDIIFWETQLLRTPRVLYYDHMRIPWHANIFKLREA